ncbi:pentatricopeptide repeat-containing protein [Tanacetum coccineum]
MSRKHKTHQQNAGHNHHRWYNQNVFIGSELIGMYSELGQFYMQDARNVFDNMSQRDVFIWNMMIQAYANSGFGNEALGVFKEMCGEVLGVDKFTYTFVLKACGVGSDVIMGRAVMGVRVFDEICDKDVVSWNTVISGCVNNRCVIEAIELFHGLLRDEYFSTPDHATLVSILRACAQAAEILLGFWIHCYIIKEGLENDSMLGSGLIAMYGNYGHLEYSRQIFDQISERNIMVWTTMMRGYGMHGNPQEALNLFSDFLKNGLHPDGVVFLCLLSTCKAIEFIESMPILPTKDVYGALLGACRMHNNIEIAEVVAQKLFVLDPESGSRYVTMAKIYEDGGRLKDAAAVRKVMVVEEVEWIKWIMWIMEPGILRIIFTDDSNEESVEREVGSTGGRESGESGGWEEELWWWRKRLNER